MATKKKATSKKKTSTRRNTKAASTTKPKGILDIAAEMVARSKKPMSAKEIVERALEKGMWKTSGKTPHATLYAAIIREISKKEKDARFTKVDRGLFTSNGGRK